MFECFCLGLSLSLPLPILKNHLQRRPHHTRHAHHRRRRIQRRNLRIPVPIPIPIASQPEPAQRRRDPAERGRREERRGFVWGCETDEAGEWDAVPCRVAFFVLVDLELWGLELGIGSVSVGVEVGVAGTITAETPSVQLRTCQRRRHLPRCRRKRRRSSQPRRRRRRTSLRTRPIERPALDRPRKQRSRSRSRRLEIRTGRTVYRRFSKEGVRIGEGGGVSCRTSRARARDFPPSNRRTPRSGPQKTVIHRYDLAYPFVRRRQRQRRRRRRPLVRLLTKQNAFPLRHVRAVLHVHFAYQAGAVA